MRIARWLTLSAALGMASCDLAQGEFGSTGTTIRGVPNGLEVIDATTRVNLQTTFLKQLYIVANVPDTGPTSPSGWYEVFLAGVDQIDGECDQYQRLLYEYSRKRSAERRGLSAIAASTAAILGLTATPAAPIALTATAFGLALNLFDARVDSIIFSAERTTVRNIILQGRRRYMEEIKPESLTSRSRVMIALRGYLMQCAPETIEANINNAANGSRFSVTSPDAKDAAAAAVAVAPGVSLQQRATTTVAKPAAGQPTAALSPPQKAPGALPDEGDITRREVMAAQRALGITPTGSLSDTSGVDTRAAIREFERGMHLRDPEGWKAADGTGLLAGRTYDELVSLSPSSSAIFRSPFERAYLGNDVRRGNVGKLSEIYPPRLNRLWKNIRPSPDASLPEDPSPANPSPTINAARVEMIRARLAEMRKQVPSIDPEKGGMLDSRLARELKLD